MNPLKQQNHSIEQTPPPQAATEFDPEQEDPTVDEFIKHFEILEPVKTVRGTPPGKFFEIPEDYQPREGSKLSLLDFEIGKPLGAGKFGHVYVVRTRQTKYIVALKRMSKKYLVAVGAECQLRREVEIHLRLKHPHIVRLYNWFHDEESVNLVMEFCVRGDVFSELRRERSFSQKKAANYLVQVCSALIHCKQKKVIHRDLKPENLLLDVHGEVKLSDFGWSVHYNKSRRKTLCGTLDYLSPELVERQEYSNEVDTWSVGVLLYEFLFGEPPFMAHSTEWTYYRIKNVELKFPIRLDVDPDAKDLIRKLLRKNPEERIELPAVYDHAWIQKYADPERIIKLKKVNGLI